MKTKQSTTRLLGGLALSLALLFAVMAITSCSFSLGADGSKAVSIDPNAAAAVIRVIAEK